jgi:ferredoxin--NADP+ reductase/benzoate/toluate 1,2-dioxygenase reductase subunit
MVNGPAHRVHHVRRLSAGTFVLRFDRHDLHFEPGQYVNLGIPGSIARREYSLYSGAGDDFLEVLVREIPGGLVSGALSRCRPGDALAVEGPYGLFTTDPAERTGARYLFVGSGTGISPFHSLTRSYPDLEYRLLHGVRTAEERHDYRSFEPSRYVACISRGQGGDYAGRVTHYLRHHPVEPDRLCYLCGNSDMIYEAFGILRDQGVPRDRLFAEVYF